MLQSSNFHEANMFSLIALYFANRQPSAVYAAQATSSVKTAANDLTAAPVTRAA